MRAGLRAHDRDCVIQQRYVPQAGQTVVCWGWRSGQIYRAAGCNVLVMERGYIGDRFAFTSMAWNGLNNRGTFPTVPDAAGARFKANHSGSLKPWNPLGDYVLIAGQVPGDMSLQGRDLHPWYEEQAARWRARGKTVMFRPHPLAAKRAPVLPVAGAPVLAGEMTDAIAHAELVVTYNSNLGVDALLAGKLIHVEDCGSMAWGWIDRTEWAHALAWRQFTLDEIRSGFAWSVANG